MRRGFRNLWDNFECSNIQITGMPEEEENQELENLFENIMKNFPNQAKEIDRLPGSPGSWESPKVGPKEAHTKVHHNYISQD